MTTHESGPLRPRLARGCALAWALHEATTSAKRSKPPSRSTHRRRGPSHSRHPARSRASRWCSVGQCLSRSRDPSTSMASVANALRHRPAGAHAPRASASHSLTESRKIAALPARAASTSQWTHVGLVDLSIQPDPPMLRSLASARQSVNSGSHAAGALRNAASTASQSSRWVATISCRSSAEMVSCWPSAAPSDCSNRRIRPMYSTAPMPSRCAIRHCHSSMHAVVWRPNWLAARSSRSRSARSTKPGRRRARPAVVPGAIPTICAAPRSATWSSPASRNGSPCR